LYFRLAIPRDLLRFFDGRLELRQDARTGKARKFALMMYGTVKKMQREGISLNAIAKKLNEDGTLTASGRSGSWTATAVAHVIRQAHVD
jgi:hypothetical protein